MQIIVTLPDEIGKELASLPNPERFISELLKAALQYRMPMEKLPSAEVKKRPLGILEGKANFEIKADFKMSDEELLLS